MVKRSGQTVRYYIITTVVNLAAVVIVVGGLGLVNQPEQVVAVAPPPSAIELPPLPQITFGQPQSLELPELEINLNVKPGNYRSSTEGWTLNNSDAFFNQNTLPVNDYGGNTHIYGHNIWSVFKSLHQLEVGDRLIITTEDHEFHYTFSSTKQVDPNYNAIYRYRGQPIVTLQTCSGSWNQYRQLFQFELDKVTDIKAG